MKKVRKMWNVKNMKNYVFFLLNILQPFCQKYNERSKSETQKSHSTGESRMQKRGFT